jgi:hypothetical protein
MPKSSTFYLSSIWGSLRYGGVIVENKVVSSVVSTWHDVKNELCGATDCELKWSHFFEGSHQESVNNPLLSKDPSEWRKQALWAVDSLISTKAVVPVNTYVQKDRASDSLIRETRRGKQALDTELLSIGPLLQFALYLWQNESEGEVWLDCLGSRNEETRRQELWIEQRNKNDRTGKLKRIVRELKFFDSAEEELIQVADVVSGVLWAASEGDDEFLGSLLKKYFPKMVPKYVLMRVF